MANRSDNRRAFLEDTYDTALLGAAYWCESIFPSEDGRGYVVTPHGDDATTVPGTIVDIMARGWAKYQGQSLSGHEYGQEALLANKTNGYEGDYDADVADIVLQLGVFGRVVYG